MEKKWTLNLLTILILSVACSQQKNHSNMINEMIHPYIETNNFSGTVIVANKDKILFKQHYGYADFEQKLSHTDESAFYLASTSMAITSFAIMQIVAQGKLSLTEPLSTYFPNMLVAKQLTLHLLLAQRSGIQSISRIPNLPYMDITLNVQYTDKLISYFNDMPLNFTPDSTYSHARSDNI